MALEAFRLSGPIISVLHLLALAVNHYLGIVRPLHYASMVTKRTAIILIALIWTVPCFYVFIYFSSIPGQGFQSENCTNYRFLVENVFRSLYSCIFFIPLLPMIVMYSHIFMIVKRHQRGLSKYSSDPSLKKNIKATVTTLLILGTYILGWVPAVLFYVVVCTNCTVHPDRISRDNMAAISIVANCLVLLKSFLDPLIYAARTREIREALRRMKRLFCPCLPSYRSNRMHYRNDTMMTSFTASMRNGKGTSIRSQSFSRKSSTYV